jgi:hypothetical protein
MSRLGKYQAKSLKNGQGVLFTNHDKVDDWSPDMRGEIFIDGELMRCGAWIKYTDHGMLISIGIDKFQNQNRGNE